MKEFESREKESRDHDLLRAYRLAHESDAPEDLENWQIAERIVEVLDDPKWIPEDLAKECVYKIVHEIEYPDTETQRRIVFTAEEAARAVFPELKNIDEVHMDQVEWAHRKFKEKQKEESV